MNQPTIGALFVRVGDLTLLSQAYRELQASVDRGDRSVSDAGLQRFRQMIAEVEDLSDQATKPGHVSNVWEGRR